MGDESEARAELRVKDVSLDKSFPCRITPGEYFELTEKPRILFIDAYDSFTNNIVSLLKTLLDAEVFVVRMDFKTLDGQDIPQNELEHMIPAFDAVVCGPGPGSPLNKEDVGAFEFLWSLEGKLMLPVLGICLGFQSLVLQFGGGIRKLKRGLHGMVREIEHSDFVPGEIFTNVSPFKATLYHSLCADIGQDEVPGDAWRRFRKWKPSPKAPDLVPLAWVTNRGVAGEERILMAVRHMTKPFWGLQYHPESICTDAAGHQVLKNWFREVREWNIKHRVVRRDFVVDNFKGKRPNLLRRADFEAFRGRMPEGRPEIPYSLQSGGCFTGSPNSAKNLLAFHPSDIRRYEYSYQVLRLPSGVGVPEVVEALGLGGGESIILDSSSAANGDSLASNSIIAIDVDKAPKFQYHVGDQSVFVHDPSTELEYPELDPEISPGHVEDVGSYIWQLMSEFWEMRRDPIGSNETPSVFKGGFMGYVTYEWGLQNLDVHEKHKERSHRRPDVCFAWITRSIVLDHRAGAVYIQGLGDSLKEIPWIEQIEQRLRNSSLWKDRDPLNGFEEKPNGLASTGARNIGHLKIITPETNQYEDKVRRCQQYITTGDSYELCLTDQTIMSRPMGDDTPEHLREYTTGEGSNHSSPWKIYKALRKRQPAPFGSFIRLGGATLLSSSPERFLTHDQDGVCSMRPMKGTVRKSEAVQTLAQARKILRVPKEEAENLMIVDLVRHDLYGVCGSGNVSVPALMRVEEYATVFQMVSVVNGTLPLAQAINGEVAPRSSQQDAQSLGYIYPFTGFDALTAALPPGSMTGAPKKRSCQILQKIEDEQERSLYSGVVGYMDVTGRGDWSVTIRSMFRWDDDLESSPTGQLPDKEVWRIGAGGAVTILSTPEGEADEMFTKLSGPLGVFRDTA